MSFTRSPEPPVFIENLQEFYSEILEYYDELFPLKDEVVQFFVKLQQEQQEDSRPGPAPLCRLLDIGCATGSLENRLSGYVMDITGIDKNPDMIETATRRMKRVTSTLRFFEMSALEMRRFLKQGSFHIISCIENTLPYISDETLLRKFFHDACELLATGGKFVVQTLNFDSILKNTKLQLPDLRSVRVTLQRSFLKAENGLFTLDSALELGNGRKIILQKTTQVLPATKAQIESYAKEAGFSTCASYSDFLQNEWTEEGSLTVLVFCKA